MKIRLFVALAAVFALFAAIGFAQERVRYDDHTVVTVQPRTGAELSIVENLPGRLLSEAISRTGADFAMTEAQLEQLRETGVPFRIRDIDLQAMIDEEFDRIERARQERGVGWFDEFRTYDEINAYLLNLANQFPDLIDIESAGASVEGRTINVATITAGEPAGKPAIFFNAAEHAREWISPMTAMYITDQVARRYGSDARITSLLDDLTIYIMPVTNPDGYQYSWDADRFWRKNRRNNGDGTSGVDINRNYGAGWGGLGSSGSTSSDIYRGESPFSEPETRVVRDFILDRPEILAHIDYHSFSQLILWPFGYVSDEPASPDIDVLAGLGVEMSNLISDFSGRFYVPQPAHDLYIASGVATDWAYEIGGLFSWTFELRPDSGSFDGFAPPADQIIPTGEENLEAALLLADVIASGVRFAFPDDTPSFASPDGSTTIVVGLTPIVSAPIDPATFALRARLAGEQTFTSLPGSALGENLFEATLPMAACGETIEYYFEVQDVDGAIYTSPRNAPGSFYSALIQQEETVLVDSLETDTGWIVGAPTDTATTGVWERVDPVGTFSGGVAVQPDEDATPDPGLLCYITGQSNPGDSIGANDVDGGETTLTTPAMNALDGDGDAYISYARWYSNSAGANPGTEIFSIEISADDGQTWTTLEEIDSEAAFWATQTFRISDFIDPSGQVRLRFIARDLVENGGAVVEAGVDDLRLFFRGCPDVSPGADLTGDGVVSSEDLAVLLGQWGPCPAESACDGDIDGDGSVGSADLAILLGAWGG